MKKSRIVGFALTLAATMVVGSAMGQVYNNTNFVELKKATVGTNSAGTLEDTSYVQVSKKYGYYATPDAAFHPLYQTNGTLTADFSWSWDVTAATGFTTSGAADNYVEITAPAAPAVGRVVVKEKAPAAWGGCQDANGFDFFISAFPEPSFVIKTGGDEGKKYCGGNADAKVYFTLSSSGTPYVKYTVSTAKGKITDATGTITNAAAFVDVAKSDDFGKPGWAVNEAAGKASTAITAGNSGAQVSVLSRPVSQSGKLAQYDLMIQQHLPDASTLSDAITIYRISLNQINGLISRKSDLVTATGAAGTYAYYPTTAVTDKYHDVYVIKAPTTGPVYHISNNKAN